MTLRHLLTFISLVGLAGMSPAVVASETFGLVTSAEGPVLELKLGEGIETGRSVVIDPSGRLRITDVLGNQYVIVGKAQVSFTDRGRILLHNGSLKVKSARGQKPQIDTVYLSGVVSGSAVVWIASGKTQWMTLDGSSETWHPQLPQSQVQVQTGYFTEISNTEDFLQPHSPLLVEVDTAKVFLARFGDPVSEQIFRHPPPLKQEKPVLSRSVASVSEPVQVVEKVDPEMMARLKAHIQGQDYEDLKAELVQQAKLNQKKQSASRLKYMSRVLAREQAYRKLMGTQTASQASSQVISQVKKLDRAPAAQAKPEVEAVDMSEENEANEAALIQQHGIINRLIKGDGPHP